MDKQGSYADFFGRAVNPDQCISHQHLSKTKSLTSKVGREPGQDDNWNGMSRNSPLDPRGRIFMLDAPGRQRIVTGDRVCSRAHKDARHTR